MDEFRGRLFGQLTLSNNPLLAGGREAGSAVHCRGRRSGRIGKTRLIP